MFIPTSKCWPKTGKTVGNKVVIKTHLFWINQRFFQFCNFKQYNVHPWRGDKIVPQEFVSNRKIKPGFIQNGGQGFFSIWTTAKLLGRFLLHNKITYNRGGIYFSYFSN